MMEVETNTNERGGEAFTEKSGFKLPGLRWVIIGMVFFATLINYIDRLTISDLELFCPTRA